MWLGASKDRPDQPLGLTWVRKMKILGVVFGTISTEMENWQPKIDKLEKTLNLWKSRSLSYVGKCLNLNVLGLSKLLYLARILILPGWVAARVNSLLWPFIWGSRIETVSRKTCCLLSKAGGLNLVHLGWKSESLRLASVLSTLDSADDSYFSMCKYFIGGRLSTLHEHWSKLRDLSTPCAATPTLFYLSCLAILDKIIGRCDEFSSKKIYRALMSADVSPPVLPYQWSMFVGSTFSLQRH